MVGLTTTSDDQFLDEIRRRGRMTVRELLEASGVTENAVRHRLNRLMSMGLVQREEVRGSRGRPYHAYALTERASQRFASNYADLAVTLWNGIKQIGDRETRRELARGICDALVARYRDEIPAGSLERRLEGLRKVFADRGIDLEIDREHALPIIREWECPYAELAEVDRGICALEKQMYQKLLGSPVRLAQCRFDGHDCCEFEAKRGPSASTT